MLVAVILQNHQDQHQICKFAGGVPLFFLVAFYPGVLHGELAWARGPESSLQGETESCEARIQRNRMVVATVAKQTPQEN